MKPKILFVDSEEKVLESIGNQLFSKLGEWDQYFASNAEKAASLLNAREFDVVVADMRMPGVNADAFLGEVRDKYPSIIRVVLSCYDFPEAAIAAIPYAHQYLSKPCKQETLISTIESSLEIQQATEDMDVRLGISKVMQLPAQLGVYSELVSVMESEYSDFEDIAAVVEKDPSLMVKVMFVANSALFATSSPAESTHEAVQRLGGRALKMLVLAVEMADLIDVSTAEQDNETDQERFRLIASTLLDDHPKHHMAGAIAAILHDLGSMIFNNFVTERYQQNVLSQARDKRHRVQLEFAEFGVSYADLGALLLNLWRLPEQVVNAVRNQHSCDPESYIDEPVSMSLMLASCIVEGQDAETILERLPESHRDCWQEKVERLVSFS